MSAADRPEAPGPSPRGRARHIQHGPLPADPIPATSAWRPGDPAGHRQFAAVGQLPTEAGSVIPDVTVAYETWGTLNSARDNAILVLHALTGDSHVTGAAGLATAPLAGGTTSWDPARRSTPTATSWSRRTH